MKKSHNITVAMKQSALEQHKTDSHPEIQTPNDLFSLLLNVFKNKKSIALPKGFHPADAEESVYTDAMVIVIDRSKFGNRKLPAEWYELLHPYLFQSIIFSRSKNNLYDAQFLPFIRLGGDEALKQLAYNTIGKTTPWQILQSITNGNQTGASVYVMPYSYAYRITNELKYKIIWPSDGYIPVPLQMEPAEKVQDTIRVAASISL